MFLFLFCYSYEKEKKGKKKKNPDILDRFSLKIYYKSVLPK